MFTKDEAVGFLQNTWQVENVEARLQTDRKKFLNELIVLIREKVPFQTLIGIKYFRMPAEQRVLPNVEEIEKMGMAGLGGNCTFVNLFTRSLLCGLGYSVFVCRAIGTSFTHLPHLVLIVKDLENERDIHLVDCGLSVPSFQAIPLNFDQESPVYRDSYLEYKFIRKGGMIYRMHGQGDVVKRGDPPTKYLDFVIGKWRRFYEFAVETIGCQTLDDLGPFHNLSVIPPIALRPLAIRFPGGKVVSIVIDQLTLEKYDGTLEKTKLETDDEILNAYRKYFPTIDENLVVEVYSIGQPAGLTSKY